MNDDKRVLAAVYVPARVTDGDLPAYVARSIDGPVDGRCLFQDPRGKGRWVCVLAANHEGEHG